MCIEGKKAYKYIWVVVKHHGAAAPQWVPGSELMPREAQAHVGEHRLLLVRACRPQKKSCASY